jgi:hypothetical protein
MPRPRIFISHAAKDDPTLLRAIRAALEAQNFDVLLDEKLLAGGDDWRNEIYTWIFRAHGAVVVFTETAKDRPWVKFELTALLQRRLLDGIKVVPVLVPPLTDAALREQQFDPHDIARLQAVTIAAANANEIASLVALFDELARKLGPKTPFEFLQGVIEKTLKVDTDVLENTALAIDPAAQSTNKPSVAAVLLYAPAGKLPAALQQLGSELTQSELEKILSIVTPFWIDPKSIIDIAREATASAPHRILLLNTTNDVIAAMYVRRAALQYPLSWALIPVTAAAGDDPVGSVRAELRDWFRRNNPMLTNAKPEEVDASIAATLAPVVVVVPSALKIERIAELRDHYATCIFISLAGDAIPDDATLKTFNAIVVEPRLDIAREQAIKQEYGACRIVISDAAK